MRLAGRLLVTAFGFKEVSLYKKASPSMRFYKCHIPRFASHWPALDKSAARIDDDVASFKVIPVERSTFHNISESFRHFLRAISFAGLVFGYCN